MSGQGYWGTTKPPPGVPLDTGHPLAQVLKAYWPINEGAGSRVANVVSPASQGTLTGGSPWGGGPGGSALGFTGAEYVDLGNDAGIKILAGTIGAWVCVTGGSGYRGILNLANVVGGSWSAWALAVNGTDWVFESQGAPGNVSISAPQTSGWHLVVAMLDAGFLKLYVDGVSAATPVSAGRNTFVYEASQRPAVLGGSRSGFTGNIDSNFIGQIDTAFVVNRALASTEIQELYARRYALFAPPVWRRYFIPTAAVQLAAPVSDVSAGGWTPSTGSDLYAMLDETVADDSDYILSAQAPANAEAKVRLSALSDPNVSTGHIVNYRFYKAPDGGAQGDLTVTLYAADGTTAIASNVHTNVAPGVVAGTFTLTGPQADAIPSADYGTGLIIGVKANAP